MKTNFKVRSNKAKRIFTLYVDGSVYRTAEKMLSKQEFEERTYYTEADWRNSLHNDNIFAVVK